MSGAGIDLSSLSVVEGKICWDLYIEGLVVSSDGNLLDALAAAIKVCLYILFLVLMNFSSKFQAPYSFLACGTVEYIGGFKLPFFI